MLMVSIQAVDAQKLSKKERKEQKAAEVKELINSGEYVFVANSAMPMAGRRIDLTSNYDLKIKGNHVEAWLPYFGRAYSAPYGGGEGGIKFKEDVEDINVEFIEKKKSYTIDLEAKTDVDTYVMSLSVGLSGFATLNVVSNNRQSISYYGLIEAIEEDKE